MKDGQRLELTLLVSKKVLNDALIPIAKENWQQIGVVLKPQVVDFNALMAQRKAGNYDLASFSTSTLNDPHDGVWDFYSTEAKESGYNNPQVDKLINEGNALLDVESVSRFTISCIRCWRKTRRSFFSATARFSRPAAPGYPVLNRIFITA